MRSTLRQAGSIVSTIPAPLYGFCCFYAWFSMLTSPRLVPALDGFMPFVPFDVGICLVYLAMLLTPALEPSPKTVGRSMAVGSVLCLAGSAAHLVVIQPQLGVSASFDALVVVVCGCGFSLVTLGWKCFFVSLGTGQVVLLFCGAKLLADVIVFAVAGYNDAYYSGALLVVLLAGCASARMAAGHLAPTTPRESLVLRSIWKLLLLCAVYGIAYGYGASGLESDSTELLLADALLSALIVGCLLFLPGFDCIALHHLGLPLAIAAFLLIPVLPAVPEAVSSVSLRVSYTCILVYTTVVSCSVCRQNSLSPVMVFSACGLGVHVPIRVGSALAALTQAAASETFADAVPTVLLICAAVVDSCLIARQRLLSSSWGFADASTKPSAVGVFGRRGETMQLWQARYGFTAREFELFDLLVQGMTTTQIAASLFISEGTVKAHVQHIYRKADVHSREELVGRFEEDLRKA